MTQTLIQDLLIILGGGLVASLLCRRLHISVLIGYLVVGTLLGRGGLGWVIDANHQLESFAEIGVFLLLFSIGLEFSIDSMKRLGRHLLVSGIVQMTLVAVPVGMILFFAGKSWQASTLIAAATSLSSTVLVFKALSEWGQSQRPHGQRAIGILLFQDAALVPLLLLVPMLTGTGNSVGWLDVAVLVLTSVCFVVAVVVLRRLLSGWLIPRLTSYRSPEVVILFTVVALGSVTLTAYSVGLPPAIGAFAAGLIFNGNRWTGQVDALVLPFRETFSAVFFVGLGLIFDPRLILNEPLMMAFALIVIIALKAFAATVALKMTGLTLARSFGMGIGLAHVGEFAFVLSLLGLTTNVIEEADYQRIVAIAIGSLILTPPLLKAGLKLIRDEDADELGSSVSLPDQQRLQAVVIGAGPIGRRVAAQLETLGKDVCLVDMSPINLHSFAQEGFRTVSGDATDSSILNLAGTEEAGLHVICVPDDSSAISIVQAIRLINQETKLIVRCRYQSNAAKLKKAGADQVVSEEAEASVALLRTLASDETNSN
jgi:monovalent cation:H+ antiporter-2, CPA2 family